jgi:polypeptide N-acetylgalactosaminyltransferase
MREAMNCQSFDWYMKNVYPEKFIPDRDVQHYGRVLPYSAALCMDSLSAELDADYTLGLADCAPYSLVMALTNIGTLRTDRSCATIRDDEGLIC